MANPYTSQSAVNYNASPPPDDGTKVAANAVTWAAIKTKLADPLLNFVNAVNGAVSNAFATLFLSSVSPQGANFTVTSAMRGALINLSNGATANLLSATVAGSGWSVTFRNNGTSASALSPNGTDNIDGANVSVTLNPGDSVTIVSDGSGWWSGAKFVNVTRSYLAGLTLSNDVGTPNTKLDVAAGICADDTNVAMISLPSGGTIDCTTTGANGLDTGSLAASTWYHVFAISKPGGVTPALLASTSLSSPTFPSGYTLKRRIGSIKTDASAHILAFVQNGDEFIWKASVNVNIPALGTTRSTFAVNVPPGLKVNVLFRSDMSSASTGVTVIFTSPDENDQAPGAGLQDLNNNAASSVSSGRFNVRSDAAQNISARANTAATNVDIGVFGWIDTRGKNS